MLLSWMLDIEIIITRILDHAFIFQGGFDQYDA